MAVNLVLPLNAGTVGANVIWMVLVAALIWGIVLQQRSSPRLLQLRYLRDGEMVTFPLETYHSQLPVEEDASEEVEGKSTTDPGPSWMCAKCGEENSRNFDECWKCQGVRAKDNSTPDTCRPPQAGSTAV
jgi:hypothetical protein